MSNAKRVYIDGQYVGTDLTTGGVPGGRYKTWNEARAAASGRPITKRCSACRACLPLAEFNRSAASDDGRQSHCRDCTVLEHLRSNPKWRTQTNIWRGAAPGGKYIAMANRPEGWKQATTAAEARAMVTGLPASEIVARSSRHASTGSDEIQHPELTRIRAEHIRRYALADKVESAARDGFVYVMYHTIYSPGIVKVGHSRDPYRRAAQANTNSAEGQHRIIYMRYFKDRALAESLVHSLLWHRRVQGEHFRVSVGEAIRVIAGLEG